MATVEPTHQIVPGGGVFTVHNREQAARLMPAKEFGIQFTISLSRVDVWLAMEKTGAAQRRAGRTEGTNHYAMVVAGVSPSYLKDGLFSS